MSSVSVDFKVSSILVPVGTTGFLQNCYVFLIFSSIAQLRSNFLYNQFIDREKLPYWETFGITPELFS